MYDVDMSDAAKVLLRLDPELLKELDAELAAKYAPMKPPSRNNALELAVREFVDRLKAERTGKNDSREASR